MTTKIAVGDARKKLKLCPDDFFNMAATSPPYWLKRNYHAGPDEIGETGDEKSDLGTCVGHF